MRCYACCRRLHAAAKSYYQHAADAIRHAAAAITLLRRYYLLPPLPLSLPPLFRRCRYFDVDFDAAAAMMPCDITRVPLLPPPVLLPMMELPRHCCQRRFFTLISFDAPP